MMIEEEHLEETIAFLELCFQVEAVFHTQPFGNVAYDSAYRLAHFEGSHFCRSLRHLALRIPR